MGRPLCPLLATLAAAQEAVGREEIWRHIQHFAPLLAALGRRVLIETWQRIQAAERLAGKGGGER